MAEPPGTDDDTAQAWAEAGATVLRCDEEGASGVVGRPGTFAAKVNLAARQTSEPWLFLTGDDVRFHPGWLDHAQATAGDRFHVIGTNDLGNPRVIAGQHATHLLVRRSYIEQAGASLDGPGTVAHEGYRHWFVDDEIIAVAKQRGVWAMALASRVEHLHPLWGKGVEDDTYRLGQASADADGKLFADRLAGWGQDLEGPR